MTSKSFVYHLPLYGNKLSKKNDIGIADLLFSLDLEKIEREGKIEKILQSTCIGPHVSPEGEFSDHNDTIYLTYTVFYSQKK